MYFTLPEMCFLFPGMYFVFPKTDLLVDIMALKTEVVAKYSNYTIMGSWKGRYGWMQT